MCMTEHDIEQLMIDRLQAQGYSYIYGPDIAPAATVRNADRLETCC